MLEKIRHTIYFSASLKTVISLLLAIGIGIFSNTFVSEISYEEKILWSSFYKSFSFYAICVLGLLNFLYYRFCYTHESDVQNFRDAEFCIAYARSKLLPEQVESYRKKIRNGDLEDFKAAMDEIKKVLK